MLSWGLNVVRDLQQLASPSLDIVCRSLSFLGNESFYMLVFPFVWVFRGWKTGVKMTVSLLLALYLGAVLKDLLALPRPFDLDPLVQRTTSDQPYGFPSLHAIGTVVFWGLLVKDFANRRFTFFAFSILFGVGFSRVYLGAHFPADILGGWAIGLGLLTTATVLWPIAAARTSTIGTLKQLLLALASSLLLLCFHPSALVTTLCGLLLGHLSGAALLNRFQYASDRSSRGQRVLASFIGTIGVFLVFIILKKAFSFATDDFFITAFRFLRYAAVGLAMSLGVMQIQKCVPERDYSTLKDP
ncbi:MAG: phosphatase PAP2 family protein [Pseudomonadota bacterium]